MVQQVAKLREESSMLKLFTEHVKGEEMYGLTVHAVMRITESVRIRSKIPVIIEELETTSDIVLGGSTVSDFSNPCYR